jgi:probable phosphomutase (TIGR03848 family)
MSEFWLVRHGSTDTLDREIAGRRPGVALNARGRAEVSALALRLAHEDFAAVYASPLERTRETANAIVEKQHREVVACDALNELQFGAWTGLAFDELERDPRWQCFNVFRSGTRIPDGETMLETQARAVAVLLELRSRHPDERVLLVTHGDVIRAVIAHVLGMPLDFYARLEVAPASISVIALDDRTTRVCRMNDVAHLAARISV